MARSVWGAHNAGTGVRSAVRLGALVRAAMSGARAGSAERGKEVVVSVCAMVNMWNRSKRRETHEHGTLCDSLGKGGEDGTRGGL